MKNKTNSAERLFQDVRTSSEEMTSSDVKKVTKMDQKIGPNGPKWVQVGGLRLGGRSSGGTEVRFMDTFGPF